MSKATLVGHSGRYGQVGTKKDMLRNAASWRPSAGGLGYLSGDPQWPPFPGRTSWPPASRPFWFTIMPALPGRDDPGDRLWPHTRQWGWRAVRAAGDAACLGARISSPQMLRHSHATHARLGTTAICVHVEPGRRTGAHLDPLWPRGTIPGAYRQKYPAGLRAVPGKPCGA